MTILKKVLTRFLLKRKWTLNLSDLGMAVVTSAISFAAFRRKHGEIDESRWYKR